MCAVNHCEKQRDRDWFAEFMHCCHDPQSQDPICGSHLDGTNGTIYYNQCAIKQARYLNPGMCILKRRQGSRDCQCGGMYYISKARNRCILWFSPPPPICLYP